MSRTGECPFCGDQHKDLVVGTERVRYCQECRNTELRLIGLGNNGDPEAAVLLEKFEKKLRQLAAPPLVNKAIVYAKERWKF